jgi:hypothetical protein
MKTIVSVQDLIELEIKPDVLLAEFYALTAKAVDETLVVEASLHVACPGCGSPQASPAFKKSGLAYQQCGNCASLYVSPRPSQAALTDYYRNSRPARFWREHILPVTEAVRLEKIVQPRAMWVLDALAEAGFKTACGLDLSSHGRALVDEILQAGSVVQHVTAAHPLAEKDFSPLPEKVDLKPRPLGEVEALGPVDFVTAFDVLDRCADAAALVRGVLGVLHPGGLLFIVAPCISGFELQVLWERARSIMPPDKLNLLSVEGFTSLFPVPQWEICEFSTPGMLDVQNVIRCIRENPDADWPRFIRYMLTKRDENARMAFQEFLQAHRLSSFARLVVRKIA